MFHGCMKTFNVVPFVWWGFVVFVNNDTSYCMWLISVSKVWQLIALLSCIDCYLCQHCCHVDSRVEAKHMSWISNLAPLKSKMHYTLSMACMKQVLWALRSRDITLWVWVDWDKLNIGLPVCTTEVDDWEFKLRLILGKACWVKLTALGKKRFCDVKVMSQRKYFRKFGNAQLRLFLLSCLVLCIWLLLVPRRNRGHRCTLISLMIILITSCSTKSPFPFIQNVLIKEKWGDIKLSLHNQDEKTLSFLFEQFYPFLCPYFFHSFLFYLVNSNSTCTSKITLWYSGAHPWKDIKSNTGFYNFKKTAGHNISFHIQSALNRSMDYDSQV